MILIIECDVEKIRIQFRRCGWDRTRCIDLDFDNITTEGPIASVVEGTNVFEARCLYDELHVDTEHSYKYQKEHLHSLLIHSRGGCIRIEFELGPPVTRHTRTSAF